MTRSHDSQSAFDRWLDAMLAGESTPADGALEADPDATLRSTAYQVHALLGAADRDEGVTGRLESIWEKLDMHASSPAPRIGAITGTGAPRSHRGLVPVARRHYLVNAINLVLAAALVLGLGFGAWRTWNAWHTDSGQPQPTAELAALQPEVSPEPPGLGGLDSNVVLPTADECTVAPLTIEEVMTIVEVGAPGQVYDGTENREGSGVPGSQAWYQGTPSPETINGVAAAHRQWTACVIKGSWLQVLALMPAYWIEEYGPRLFFPVFTTREEAKAILVAATEQGLAPTPRDAFQNPTLTIPDPARAVIEWPLVYTSSVLFHETTGNPVAILEFVPDQSAKPRISFMWNPVAARWDVDAAIYPGG